MVKTRACYEVFKKAKKPSTWKQLLGSEARTRPANSFSDYSVDNVYFTYFDQNSDMNHLKLNNWLTKNGILFAVGEL